ncbi:RcpC/CpaB family pilus assembly protein, partial [Klebsiella pneumoniae]|nr:RcpC/CpaB family pilus assembly protein [Klebsiella pneumoniae]
QDNGNPQQSAQTVLPAVRVLSVGDELGLTSDGQPASQPLNAEEALKQAQRRVGARTAVLAVPEPLINQLMLATQAGTLRLAVRSAQEQRLSK